jgi:nucleoside-diphosphate-sugar epimerase
MADTFRTVENSLMPARRILVLGATGGTGRHVVEQAAGMGLEVTALVRTPDKLPSIGRALRVLIGDIRTDSPAVREAYGLRTPSSPPLASASRSGRES